MVKILLVDDDPVYSIIANKILEIWFEKNNAYKYIIDIVLEPKTALLTKDILSYNIIVTDYHMPYMDGITFISVLKEKGYPNKIILASSERISEERYAHLNMDVTHVNLPLTMNWVHEFMDEWIRKQYPSH